MLPETSISTFGMGYFERMIFLRTIPSLAEMPNEIAAVIAENTVERFFSEGSYIHRQGRPATTIQYIVRGEVEIQRNGKPVRRLGPRTVVGGLSALAEDDQGYDCIATEDTTTLELQSDDGQEIFEDHFIFLKRVIQNTNAEILALRKELRQNAGFAHDLSPDFDIPERPLDLVERMALLRQTFSFAQANIDGIADLARDVRECRVPKGTELWKLGDSSTFFLMPLCGAVECVAKDQSFVLGPGDSLGAVDALADKNRWFNARVSKDLVAFHVERDVLYDVLEDHFGMAMGLLRAIAGGTLSLYDQKADCVLAP